MKETIGAVQTEDDLSDVRQLFREYTSTIPPEILALQDFEAELLGLPGAYAPPGGALLLARSAEAEDDGCAIGCVALRPFKHRRTYENEDRVCEMKRLYVAPKARRTGLGKRLAEAVFERAKEQGYDKIVLDTLPTMERARQLYLSYGFVETRLMDDGPVPGTINLEKDLDRAAHKLNTKS